MGWLFRRRRASADVTRLKDLWAVRTILLPRSDLPVLSDTRRYGFRAS